MQIIPTILTNSPEELEKKINFLRSKTDWVQIDVVDGKFAPNRTFPLEWLNNYQDKNLFWEVHLMVKNPFSWVEKCNFVLAQRVVGQIEFMNDQLDFIDRVESEGMEAGLAIDLPTSLELLNQEALFRVNLVLILSVKAGFGGQKFDPNSLKKIKELVKTRQSLNANFKIGVDGGVTPELFDPIQSAGGDICYIGSSFWKEKQNFRFFKQSSSSQISP